MSTASEIHPPRPGATGARRRRGLSLGRLSVTIQLTLLSVLVGAGLVAMLVLAVLELRETSIGGRYYAEMRARAAYRTELTHLRIGLADVIAVSANARSTSDSVVFSVMRERVVDLSNEITERFARLQALTKHDHVHDRVVAVVATWREFSEVNLAALRSLTDEGPAPFVAATPLQPLRQAQFRRQVTELDESIEQAQRELEQAVAAR